MTLTADWLELKIRERFAAVRPDTPVVYGSEEDARHAATPTRVVVGLDRRGELLPAGAPGAPGLREVSSGVVARAFLTDRAGVCVWIRAVCDPTTARDDYARASQGLCKALLHEVLRALHAPAHGSLNLGSGAFYEWAPPEQVDGTYGAMIKLSFKVDIPVEDTVRTQLRLGRPSAPTATGANIALEQEVCNASACEPVTSTE